MGRIAVEVTDTGSGIASEDIPRIFDPFFTTKPVGVGTGLGLSICHRIVTGLGGEIQVESLLGKGTLVRVVLPSSSLQMEASRPPPPVIPARRRGKVLVIDDEAAIASALARLLEGEHAVTTTSTATEAQAQIAAGARYDVILCDLLMPQMTGMELHAHLLETAPEQAANMVFLTGGAFTARARAFLDRIPNQRIEKPFDTQHLRSIVNDRVR